jgi:hypothetical protein
VNALAAAWGSLRVGTAQAVWCDLDEPLDSATTGADWAWLRAILATGVLSGHVASFRLVRSAHHPVVLPSENR